MTTADVETTKRRTPATRSDNGNALSTELVDAGTLLAERGVKLARTAAETSLKVTDALVLGTLGVAEEWASATPVAQLTVPPVKVARETWSTTREGLRELVAAV
jgi:methionine synthase I (cobalamin-dependent)